MELGMELEKRGQAISRRGAATAGVRGRRLGARLVKLIEKAVERGQARHFDQSQQRHLEVEPGLGGPAQSVFDPGEDIEAAQQILFAEAVRELGEPLALLRPLQEVVGRAPPEPPSGPAGSA